MATANVLATKERYTQEQETRVTDWALQGGAMFGAVAGALSGVTVAGTMVPGTYASVLLGTGGIILGSIVCALTSRYLILPLWQSMLRTSKH